MNSVLSSTATYGFVSDGSGLASEKSLCSESMKRIAAFPNSVYAKKGIVPDGSTASEEVSFVDVSGNRVPYNPGVFVRYLSSGYSFSEASPEFSEAFLSAKSRYKSTVDRDGAIFDFWMLFDTNVSVDLMDLLIHKPEMWLVSGNSHGEASAVKLDVRLNAFWQTTLGTPGRESFRRFFAAFPDENPNSSCCFVTETSAWYEGALESETEVKEDRMVNIGTIQDKLRGATDSSQGTAHSGYLVRLNTAGRIDDSMLPSSYQGFATALAAEEAARKNADSSILGSLRTEISDRSAENANLSDRLDDISEKTEQLSSTVDAHVANTDNPHAVTPVQLGLGNVDNTHDVDKPVSNAVRTELDKKLSVDVAESTYALKSDVQAMSVQLSSLAESKQDNLDFDNEPTTGSTNPVTSEGIKTYVDVKVGDAIDSFQDSFAPKNYSTSETVVQKIASLDNEIANKADRLTFDNTPNSDSFNPVTSSGIKTYVDTKLQDLSESISEGYVPSSYENTTVIGKLGDLDAAVQTLRAESDTTSEKLEDVEDRIDQLDRSKEDNLDFDNTPTEGSDNVVTSSGIKRYVDNAVENGDYAPKTISLNGESVLLADVVVDTGSRVRGTAVRIGSNATVTKDSDRSVAVGYNTTSSAPNTVAIGVESTARLTDAVAVGYRAESAASGAVQIGEGVNDQSNTLKFRNFPIVSASGKIYPERLDFDTTPTKGSDHIVTSDGIWKYVDEIAKTKEDNLTFDDTPDPDSDNPVKSSGIVTYVDAMVAGKQNQLDFDTTPTEGSNHVVTSDGIWKYVNSKTTPYELLDDVEQESENPVKSKGIAKYISDISDDEPTADSTNLVTSGGVVTYVDGQINSALGQSAAFPGWKNGYTLVAGYNAGSTGSGSTIETNPKNVVFGCNTQARGMRDVAIGADSNVADNSDYSQAIGDNNVVNGGRNIAIGGHNDVYSGHSVVIGNHRSTKQGSSGVVAVGGNTNGNNSSNIIDSGNFSTVIGGNSNGSGASTVAVGYNAKAIFDKSIVIGADTESERPYDVVLGGPLSASEASAVTDWKFSVRGYPLIDSKGVIPVERIPKTNFLTKNEASSIYMSRKTALGRNFQKIELKANSIFSIVETITLLPGYIMHIIFPERANEVTSNATLRENTLNLSFEARTQAETEVGREFSVLVDTRKEVWPCKVLWAPSVTSETGSTINLTFVAEANAVSLNVPAGICTEFVFTELTESIMNVARRDLVQLDLS